MFPNGQKSKHPDYGLYRSMLNRCKNSRYPQYEYYGGRGITVCDRWKGKDGFANFVKDMGARPKNLSLDRINNDKGYSPDNCRWANKSSQAINSRTASHNKSGVRGVHFDNTHGKWYARIKVNNKYISLGLHKEKQAAIAARKKAELEHPAFKKALTGVAMFVLAAVGLLTIKTPTVEAKSLPLFESQQSSLELILQKPPKEPNPKELKKYTVKSGDSLTKIAQLYNSSVQKLYNKNKQIKNPDVLKVGQVIVIPHKSEKLKHRSMSQVYSESPSKRLRNAQTAGNGYSYGYCTWYVKNKRPDIPNSWGNADTWDDYAPGSGYRVGSTPKAGAIGVTRAYMHVVYIEKVNKDGTVLVSEMNYNGWNVVSQRVAPASEFNYIY